MLLTLVAISACSKEVIFDFEENLQEELLAIDQFLNENQSSYLELENEIRYRFIEEGAGPGVDLRDTVKSFYAIYLLDSTLITSNVREVLDANGAMDRSSEIFADVIELGLDNRRRLQFLNEAYKLSRNGTSIQMFVPSYLAFGSNPFPSAFVNSVPPDTPIMLEIEVAELIKVD